MSFILPLFSVGMHLLFYVLMLIFVVYTLFLGYHWFNYGQSKKVSTLALAVFLIVSAPLFIAMSFSLSLLPV